MKGIFNFQSNLCNLTFENIQNKDVNKTQAVNFSFVDDSDIEEEDKQNLDLPKSPTIPLQTQFFLSLKNVKRKL